MKSVLWSARSVWMFMLLASFVVIYATPSAGAILPNDTCALGAQCPGAPILGSTLFIIPEIHGRAVLLKDLLTGKTDHVYSGDVLIYEDTAGTVLSDLLRFPDNLGNGVSSEAILYSADDPGAGAIPTDRQALVISIAENTVGDTTTYIAKTGATHEIDYNLISPATSPTPEPGTAALVGVTGLMLVVGMRLKAA